MNRESAIQMQIVETLSFLAGPNSFLFFSVPNESYMLAATAKGYMSGQDNALLTLLRKMGMVSGASDLVIGHEGRLYCMEVKSEHGEQSDNQYLFEEWCRRCGVPYIVVRSVEAALQALKGWGIIA